MEPFTITMTHCPQVRQIKSQDRHGGNVALMTFGNLIVDKLATSFQQFLQNLGLMYVQKIVDNLYDFQASDSVELSFLVNWSSSNSFRISSPINSPSFSLASLLKSPNFSFKYINAAPSLIFASTMVFISPSLMRSGGRKTFLRFTKGVGFS